MTPTPLSFTLSEIRHPYGSFDPFVLPLAADRVLNEYFDTASSIGLDPFLLYGTCLGFVRNGDYIDGDNDLDVGIRGGIWELAPALIKNGFIHLATVRHNSHFIKYGILLDVWFSFPSVKYFQSFDKVIYKDRPYSVPHPVEDFLAFSYGDWRTPSPTKPFRGE